MSTHGPHELLEVGVVVKPHGLRGEVKLKLHFAESDSLEHAKTVLLRFPDGRQSEQRVASVRYAGKGLLLGLEGTRDAGAAETLRGCRVLVSRAELPPLEPGEYYLADVVGSVVHLEGAGEIVGVVRQVRPDPSVDTLVIETPEGEVVEQPLVDAWVAQVDTAARRVVLSSTDGLIR